MGSKLLAGAMVAALWVATSIPVMAQQPPPDLYRSIRLVSAQQDAGTELRRFPRNSQQLRLSSMVVERVPVADPGCQR